MPKPPPSTSTFSIFDMPVTWTNVSFSTQKASPKPVYGVGNNEAWSQVNGDLKKSLAASAIEKMKEPAEVHWPATTILRSIVQQAYKQWSVGLYAGNTAKWGHSPYESETCEQMANMGRHHLERLIIIEYPSRLGSFQVRVDGNLLFISSKGKGGSITFNGFYAGAKTPTIFRVKPTHHEKWERTTEGWDQATWNVFNSGLLRCAELYTLYKSVFNLCAERKFREGEY